MFRPQKNEGDGKFILESVSFFTKAVLQRAMHRTFTDGETRWAGM